MAAQTGPEAGQEPDRTSRAAQRERESSADKRLARETVEALQSAQETLDALSQAAQEGEESVDDLYKACKEAVLAAIDKRAGDLYRWFEHATNKVDDAASLVGRSIVVLNPLDISTALDYHSESVRIAGRATRSAAEDVAGVTALREERAADAVEVTALREELAATQRTLAEQAAAAGARATIEVVAAGVEAGVEEPEEKTVRSENGVNVRANASPTATKVDTLPKGAKVSLVPADPVDNDGYAWRKIAGPGNGWVASGPISDPDKFLA